MSIKDKNIKGQRGDAIISQSVHCERIVMHHPRPRGYVRNHHWRTSFVVVCNGLSLSALYSARAVVGYSIVAVPLLFLFSALNLQHQGSDQARLGCG